MLDKFVIDSVSDLERIQVQIHDASDTNNPDCTCRFEGCSKVFKYVKCCSNHEKKVHNMIISELDTSTVPIGIERYGDLCSQGMSNVTFNFINVIKNFIKNTNNFFSYIDAENGKVVHQIIHTEN